MLAYLMDAKWYLLPAVLVWFIGVGGVIIRCRRNGGQIGTWESGALFFLGLYVALLFSVTVSPMSGGFTFTLKGKEINLLPGAVIKDMWDNPLNFWGNIAMFLPVGVLLPFVSAPYQKGVRTIGMGMALSISIEVLQLFTFRGTDMDDVLLNTLVTAAGFFLWKGVSARFGLRKRQTRNTGRMAAYTMALMLLVVLVSGEIQRLIYLYGDCTETAVEAQQLDEQLSEELADVTLEATNACLVDVTTGQVLYEKNSQEQIAPASTTKMLTALTVVKYCSLDKLVTVGEEISDVAADASTAGLTVGNELTVRQLLEGMLLPSGNDAAYVLAVYTGRQIAGDETLDTKTAEQYFVKAMNDMAQACNAKNSNFTSPDGYDEEGQYTTVNDLLCIAKAFLSDTTEDGILAQIAGSSSIRECFADGTDITWRNTNELLNMDSDYYCAQAIGLKTGSSDEAGKCLVSAFEKNGSCYVAVVMGEEEDAQRYEDTLKLIQGL